jgi:hypothetical protein
MFRGFARAPLVVQWRILQIPAGFRLKCNLFSSHLSSSQHGSSVYGHYQVLSNLLKLLHCMSKLFIACGSDIS